jgi:hypothetical protein
METPFCTVGEKYSYFSDGEKSDFAIALIRVLVQLGITSSSG